MLIDNIVDFCDARYQKDDDCSNCTYGSNCPERCDKCLHYIHKPSAAPVPRKYDCPNMADFYICKYSHKYTSEIIYALKQLKDLKKKEHLDVMSIGCGPCTDLFALDYLCQENFYQFQTITYRGIDSAKEVWQFIHEHIKQHKDKKFKVSFWYEDITVLIDKIINSKWVPDLIIFQYVFSDMQKHCEPQKLAKFISKIAGFINEKMDDKTYIVLNDINLSTQMEGGREHFDSLLKKIAGTQFKKYHFNNSNKEKHFDYGSEYETNELIIKSPENLRSYEPFTSCASAQLIIKKVLE